MKVTTEEWNTLSEEYLAAHADFLVASSVITTSLKSKMTPTDAEWQLEERAHTRMLEARRKLSAATV